MQRHIQSALQQMLVTRALKLAAQLGAGSEHFCRPLCWRMVHIAAEQQQQQQQLQSLAAKIKVGYICGKRPDLSTNCISSLYFDSCVREFNQVSTPSCHSRCSGMKQNFTMC